MVSVCFFHLKTGVPVHTPGNFHPYYLHGKNNGNTEVYSEFYEMRNCRVVHGDHLYVCRIRGRR